VCDQIDTWVYTERKEEKCGGECNQSVSQFCDLGIDGWMMMNPRFILLDKAKKCCQWCARGCYFICRKRYHVQFGCLGHKFPNYFYIVECNMDHCNFVYGLGFKNGYSFLPPALCIDVNFVVAAANVVLCCFQVFCSVILLSLNRYD